MSVRKRWVAGALVVAAIAVAGCSEGDEGDESTGDAAAELVEVDGSDVPRVVLEPQVADRIGLEFGRVTTGADGQLTVPYAAVVYDPDGSAWVYTNPERRTFERQPITIVNVNGENAVITAGPPDGTEVVTLGTAELYGVENEIGG